MFETPAQKTKRQGIEGGVNEDYESRDSFRYDQKLDRWPYGKRRPELDNTQMTVLFPHLAHFFRAELEARASQDTQSFPAVEAA